MFNFFKRKKQLEIRGVSDEVLWQNYPASPSKRYNGWVYRCATLNAQVCTSAPLRLFAPAGRGRKYSHKAWGERDELLEHPVLELLSNANSLQTGYEFRFITFLHLELYGNAYWLVVKSPAGTPAEIYPLYPTAVAPQWSREKQAVEYRVSGSVFGEPGERIYGVDEIIHLRYPSPTDYLRGVAPAEACELAVQHYERMRRWHLDMFERAARPDLVVYVPVGLSDDEYRRLKTEWIASLRGKHHSPIFVEGDMRVEPFPSAPSSSLIDDMKAVRSEIINIFGIPETFTQISASRAEAEVHYREYIALTILPKLRLVEATLNERLLPLFDKRLTLEFAPPSVELVVDAVAKVKQLAGLGVVTANELRKDLGLDSVPWGDIALVDANKIAVEDLAGVPTEPPREE